METYDFQSLISTKLTELAVGQATIATDMRSVKEHLVRLNGKVASHERELSERRNQCPIADRLEDRIRTTEDFITASQAVQKTSSSWMKRIWPFIWVALGIFGLLILQNAGFLLKAFTH